MDSSVPLTHHDPKGLGLICFVKKRKIYFRIILTDLRIQSRIFSKKRTLRSFVIKTSRLTLSQILRQKLKNAPKVMAWVFGVTWLSVFFIQQHINIKNDLGSKWQTIENLLRKLDILARVLILFRQESFTWSVQLPCFRATAFSQAGLFLDMPFLLKLLLLVTSASKSE